MVVRIADRQVRLDRLFYGERQPLVMLLRHRFLLIDLTYITFIDKASKVAYVSRMSIGSIVPVDGLFRRA
jgi:hypothetical protein